MQPETDSGYLMSQLLFSPFLAPFVVPPLGGIAPAMPYCEASQSDSA